MPTIRTIAARCRHELERIKGSRFFATAAQATTVEAAQAVVAELRGQYPDATHHCWAWRGRGRDAHRYADDGEPSGSAGRPILNAIDGRGLSDVVVVVTRYYGGTKLGTGGLVRAYGRCAAETLDRAGFVETRTARALSLRFGYDHTGPVQAILSRFGLAAERQEFGADVELIVHVPDEEVDAFRDAVAERTAGRIVIDDAAP